MKKKLIPLVTDDEQFWDAEFNIWDYLSYPENHTTIFIARPVDDPIEAARLYKLNHNPERANKEWSFLDKVYPMYCNLFPKSWRK